MFEAVEAPSGGCPAPALTESMSNLQESPGVNSLVGLLLEVSAKGDLPEIGAIGSSLMNFGISRWSVEMDEAMTKREELNAKLAETERLLELTTERRQQAIADGNREISGKIHQAELEWKRRIEELKKELAMLPD
jgi:hypothetical protein